MADQYPPQYPRNPQGGAPNQYPPHYSQQYPPQYPQGGQPQYPPYPQAPYGQPRMTTQGRANVSNPLATRSLIYGILSIVAVAIAVFTGRLIIGAVGIYAIYYAIRGLSYAGKLPGNQGIASSVIGLILSSLAVLATIGLLILSALPGN